MSGENNTNNNNNNGGQEELISKSIYEKTKNDMLEYKKQLQALKDEKAQIEQTLQAKAQEDMIKNNKFKELYEAKDQENKTLVSKIEELSEGFKNIARLQAFEKVGGKLKNPEYAKLVDFSKIELNEDGSVVEQTVKDLFDSVKKNTPDILVLPQQQANKTSAVAPASNVSGKMSIGSQIVNSFKNNK